MECLGEEFMSSQKLLEIELHRTRMELSSLTVKLQSLHDNCSSTQETNNLLEQKLQSLVQSMEGERERLNQRIVALTEQLADAKFANSVETLNVTPVVHKTDHHFELDDGINQVVHPITPPPAQFMDSHNYEKAKTAAQEQTLGSVPEEEESDWSEMGEETPRFMLTSSKRGQSWRLQEVDVDKDSESGGEEIVRHPRQIPHFQFTIHNEILPAPQTNAHPPDYMIPKCPNFGSTILIRSASLEEIPLARHHLQKELRGTEAMMDLHYSGTEAIEDLDNEIIHHWKTSNDRESAIGRPLESRTSEVDCSLARLESAERILNHLLCEHQTSEGKGQRRAEVQGWTGGIPDQVLKGERTQL
ncbi:Tight junction-associated protein 1 [Channa argus]|uniref:Tight junction-associated protein 1 n=1 Tax=Channa argus TaxID=215402 RepID=A0A6G1QVC1_CHAAH|nr:Tight junction-associated protein 1 [Channa argus]